MSEAASRDVITHELWKPEDVYRKHVAGRVLVYLDSKPWILLTDQKDADSRKCLEACRAAHAAKRVLFPMSFASITELLEHPKEAPQLAQARLMDELSEGVTFAFHHEIVFAEILAAFPILANEAPRAVDRTQLFTYLIEYLGSHVLEYPAGADAQQATRLTEFLRSEGFGTSLEYLVTRTDLEKIRSYHRETEKKRLDDRTFQKTAERLFTAGLDKNGKPDRYALLTRERLYIFEKVILPLARGGLPPIQQVLFTKFILDLIEKTKPPTDFLDHLFAAMPSCELFAEVMAARVLNPLKKDAPGDHMDTEHARFAPAYCEAFVTERGLAHILTNMCTLPKKQGCRVFVQLRELTEFLENEVPQLHDERTRKP